MKFLNYIYILFFVLTQGIYAEKKQDPYLDIIKPLFKERCYACHGVLKQKGKLRLDTVQFMRDKGIIEDQELLFRVDTDDPDEIMPPEGHALSKSEIEAIKQWLQNGALAPENELPESEPKDHWAYKKIVKTIVPKSQHTNLIDAFLEAEQKKRGLVAQPLEEDSLLKRRLYLDLIGLPPTFEQLNEKVSIEALTDRLLSSPHYGERWGRHWMDVWRYSDWYGLGKQVRNSQKHMWHFRDWIVQSLNQDKGYDRMVMEMLAGDELAPEDPSVYTATGFLARNFFLFNRTTWLDNTVEHTSKAFLGITMNCVKCHDHKYDPLSHHDYYAMRATFEPHWVRLDMLPGQPNFDIDAIPRVYDNEPSVETYLHRRGDPAMADKSKSIEPGVPSLFASFYNKPVEKALPLHAWAPGVRPQIQTTLIHAAKTKLKKRQKELAALAQTEQIEQTQTTEHSSIIEDFNAPRPQLWDIVHSGWRYAGGVLEQEQPILEKKVVRSIIQHPKNFEMNLKLRIKGGNKWLSAGFSFDADQQGENSNSIYVSVQGQKVQVAHCVKGVLQYPATGRMNIPVIAQVDIDMKLQVVGSWLNVYIDNAFTLSYKLPHRGVDHFFELWAFDALAEFDSIQIDPLPKNTKLIKDEARVGQTTKPHEIVTLAKLKVQEAESELALLETLAAADKKFYHDKGRADYDGVILKELQYKVHKTHLAWKTKLNNKDLKKNYEQAKKNLQNKALKQATPLYGSRRAKAKASENTSEYSPFYSKVTTGRRTALAEWMTSRENPLTARVAVNHIWMRHFGEPLVKKVFDFGLRSKKPALQNLLDFLAIELIENNWSMKHLHQLMVTSKAYQRTSSTKNTANHNLTEDLNNHFYWRMNARKMESQILRDAMLHHGGELNLTMGGPSIDPNKPSQRRSLYLTHSRDTQLKFLTQFDEADVFACYKRSQSIVPQQALALYNSKETLSISPKIAALNSTKNPEHFCRRLFFTLLGRWPNSQEEQACKSYLEDVSQPERLVHALLNHNDFIMVR